MRKYLLILSAGLLFFAACTSTDNNVNNQAVVDSIANAKANAMQNAMAASNDSTINAAARTQADSMEMAKHMQTLSEQKEGHGRKENARPKIQDQAPVIPPPPDAKDVKVNR